MISFFGCLLCLRWQVQVLGADPAACGRCSSLFFFFFFWRRGTGCGEGGAPPVAMTTLWSTLDLLAASLPFIDSDVSDADDAERRPLAESCAPTAARALERSRPAPGD